MKKKTTTGQSQIFKRHEEQKAHHQYDGCAFAEVEFITPSSTYGEFVAQSKDIVVVMHFNESLTGRVFHDKMYAENVDAALVDEAFADFNKKFRRRNLRKNFRFSRGAADAGPRMTSPNSVKADRKLSLLGLNESEMELEDLPELVQ